MTVLLPRLEVPELGARKGLPTEPGICEALASTPAAPAPACVNAPGKGCIYVPLLPSLRFLQEKGTQIFSRQVTQGRLCRALSDVKSVVLRETLGAEDAEASGLPRTRVRPGREPKYWNQVSGACG